MKMMRFEDHRYLLRKIGHPRYVNPGTNWLSLPEWSCIFQELVPRGLKGGIFNKVEMNNWLGTSTYMLSNCHDYHDNSLLHLLLSIITVCNIIWLSSVSYTHGPRFLTASSLERGFSSIRKGKKREIANSCKYRCQVCRAQHYHLHHHRSDHKHRKNWAVLGS